MNVVPAWDASAFTPAIERLAAKGAADGCAAPTLPENDPISALALGLVAAFRAHGHVSNVLTHVSRGKWEAVETDLRLLLDPSSVRADLTTLAENILDLLVGESGVSGRIAAPYFRQNLQRLLSQESSEAVWSHAVDLLAAVRATPRKGSRTR